MCHRVEGTGSTRCATHCVILWPQTGKKNHQGKP